MKAVFLVACVLGSKVSPIEKTVELLVGLQAKIVKEGEAAQKLYEEFTDYCDDQSKELIHAIKTAKDDAERQSATIAHATAKIQEAESVIGDLAAKVATNSADVKAATEIRDAEKKTFEAADADLGETVDMLRRAVAIIEREMNKGASLMQASQMSSITNALQVLLDSNAVNSQNKAKVQALLQANSGEDEDDLQPGGAPAPDAYKSHSGGILSTLEDMMEKAAAQRADGQKAEMLSQHNFELLAQKLNDEIADQEKQLKATKKAKAEAEETKSIAEGDLAATQKALKEDESTLHDLQENCMVKATAYDVEKAERADELKALETATKILQEKTGAASSRTYSFLQLQVASHSQQKEKGDRLLAFVQNLANTDGTQALAQLMVRIKTTMGQAELDGDDPFAKVKGLIQDMIEKLVADAQKEAAHKAFCDEEMSETKAKKEDKEDELDTLSTKIDQATAKIAKLKEQVATLEAELAEIAKVQAEADKLRANEKSAWADAKADFEQGLEGVRMALDVLRDYYAEKDEAFIQQPTGHSKATGAASGIIGMLEVIESDFSKMLAEGQATEDQAQKEYDTLTKDNEVATATKTTEAEYKTKDSKETAARLAGLEDDKGVAQKEYSAIMEYWEKLQPMCVAKPEPYAERKKRREAEIAGLKEALQILENESAPAFLQIRRA